MQYMQKDAKNYYKFNQNNRYIDNATDQMTEEQVFGSTHEEEASVKKCPDKF